MIPADTSNPRLKPTDSAWSQIAVLTCVAVPPSGWPALAAVAVPPRDPVFGEFAGLPDDLLVVHGHVDLLDRAVRVFATDSGLPPGR
jgi:hypothetical protein